MFFGCCVMAIVPRISQNFALETRQSWLSLTQKAHGYSNEIIVGHLNLGRSRDFADRSNLSHLAPTVGVQHLVMISPRSTLATHFFDQITISRRRERATRESPDSQEAERADGNKCRKPSATTQTTSTRWHPVPMSLPVLGQPGPVTMTEPRAAQRSAIRQRGRARSSRRLRRRQGR